MAKKVLYLEDLCEFYSKYKKSMHYSASENDGKPLVVQVHGNLKFSKSSHQEGLLPVHLQANHTGVNINGSNIEDDVAQKNLDSFKNRPILGYIHNVDGQDQFYGHNRHEDEDGNTVYDEKPIGIIPESCNAQLVYDEEKGKTYVEVDGFIFEEYSTAGDILRREGECACSVELDILDIAYNAKDKYLDIKDFFYSGVTILGKDDEGNDVNPGMVGSNIKLSDFSVENNSVLDQDKLVQSLDRLTEALSKFEIDNQRKEDVQVEGINEMEVTEEVEQFEETETTEEVTETTTDEVTEVEEVTETEETPEDIVVAEESVEETEEFAEDIETEEVVEEPVEDKISCSVTVGEMTKEFSVSMNDKLMAISTLVNETYADDCTWYDCTVYDDTKEIVMVDFWSGNAFKQSYKVKGDSFSLKGDRVPVHSTWMTDDEQKAFDKMKADFSEISEKLAKYESEPQKMEILESEDYAKISELEEFKELKTQEAHFDLSVEDVKAKADDMLLAYAKQPTVVFSASEPKMASKTFMPVTAKKTSRYGSLFSNK